MPIPGGIPPLNLAASSGAQSDAAVSGGSKIFNIGGNPNVSTIAQSAENILKSPYAAMALAFAVVAYVIILRKKG